MEIPIQHPWYRRPWFPGNFPYRIYDQYFGEHLPDSELFSPYYMFYYRPYFWRFPNWWDSGMSEVILVWFEETVSVLLQDEHGTVAGEFYRKYKIPACVDPGAITASLSSDGVLTICTPRHLLDTTERSISITCGEKPPVQK
uniref:Alpha-crystallin B chain n=1 Tax=Cyprinus carpio TaxID=7962 RepID=A0A8C2JNK2_CYPCA